MDEILKSIQRIIAEDERTSIVRPVSPPPRPVAAAPDDVLELTEALNEDGTTRRLAPASSGTPTVEPALPSVAAGERIAEPGLRAEAPPLRAERVEPAVEPAVSGDIGVVSGGALALGEPVSTVEPEPREEPIVEAVASAASTVPASRTLEDLVAELLRPMLKTWLDENLPPLVEKLARAEIARSVEKSDTSAG